MPFFPKGRRRKCLCYGMAMVLACGGFWAYVIFMGSPVNSAQFDRIQLRMLQEEIEDLLGGPARNAEILAKDDFHPGPPLTAVQGRMLLVDRQRVHLNKFDGQWGGDSPILKSFLTPVDGTVAVYTWSSADAEIVVMFDAEGRATGAIFQPCPAWHHKFRHRLERLR